jgi:hypothetical protein
LRMEMAGPCLVNQQYYWVQSKRYKRQVQLLYSFFTNSSNFF